MRDMNATVSQEDKDHIDSLSRLDLCRLYRFAPIGHRYMDISNPASEYFLKKFKESGGFTSEISIQLGWD